jgi:hypothetical protein
MLFHELIADFGIGWHPNQLRHSAATRIGGQFGRQADKVAVGHVEDDVNRVYPKRRSATATAIMAEAA